MSEIPRKIGELRSMIITLLMDYGIKREDAEGIAILPQKKITTKLIRERREANN